MRYILLFMVFLVVLAACKYQEPTPSVNSFELRVGDTAEYGDLSLKFLGVSEDSRCPQGVQCIWAGRVVTLFQVVIDSEPAFLEVTTEGPTIIKKSTPVDWDYYVRLVAVSPVSMQGVSIAVEEYVISLNIKKDIGS
ncbi:MAG TPA: hypothetical protein VJB87_02690 [Candidatus Nanoarchaeia archaeon]|nr:hypothetical protein [Candidatus Nanoarchaeia archaeon]